ncbi:MAG: BatD family protein [Bacteroidales bacterium]|nr:BatD family protein [Bacteroidales bacterium]
MIRILRILFVLAILEGVTDDILGQAVEFTASAKSSVQVGEQLRVVYTVNKQVDRFEGPDFEGFSVLSGPNQSTNQSYQFINGKVSQSFQVSYTYYLQATKEGTFNINPAKVTTEGKTYESNSLTINVSQSASSQTPTQQGNQRPAQARQESVNKNDIFIKATVDRSQPFQGEQVIVTYKIYTTIPISQINISKISSFPGFWNKSLLNDNDPLKQSNEVVNGKEYVVADLRKIALYAQRSGEIKIEPMELQCVAQVKVENSRTRDPFFDSFFNDPFFNRNFQNVELKVESNPLSINVKPLPASGKPLDFSGAVGSFNISSEIDRTELKSNEPITLKFTISGKGNLELIEAMPLSFPPDFETYDPKITNDLTKNSNGISGSITFEYLIIPRNPGEFQIKPVEFSFFDPVKQSYTTLSTPLYNIKVNKGEDESSGITYSGVSQKNIQFIGSDIRHIKTGHIQLYRINSFFIASSSFIFWLIIPALLFITIIILWSKNKKRSGNIALVRNRKANKVARKNLQKAGEYLQSNSTGAFFEEISRALWGYISNKFNIPLSDLSIESVNQRLSDKSISEESIRKFTGVLENCEYARFAPGDKSEKMQGIYNEALEVISKIEQELK